MEIFSLDRIDSTQIYLKNALKDGLISAPALVYTLDQTSGIGSRDNSWQGAKGNLALSFVVDKATLPDDLPLQSSSIYFGSIFKNSLARQEENIWLKWPNDLYIGSDKVGGVITQVMGQFLVCGIGLNLIPTKNYQNIASKVDVGLLIETFIDNISHNFSWGQIFSQYQIEFHKNYQFYAHKDGEKFSLKEATLEADGSVVLDGERVFSNR